MKILKTLILVYCLFALTSCKNKEKASEKSQKEFYSILNYLIDSELTDISAISSSTLPIIKPFQIPAERIIDTVRRNEPEQFDIIQYNWLSIYPLAQRRNLNRNEVDFMYHSIDSSKIFVIDSNMIKVPIITKTKFLKLFQDSGIAVGYERMRRIYGTSNYVSISTPVFNSSFTKVIISINYYCGPLCGNGYEFVLEKKKGIWRISSKNVTWKS